MEFLPWIFRLCLMMLVHTVLVSCLGNNTDRHALLALKDGITQDPHQVISSWNNSFHFCKWVGVTCRLPNQRVVALNLGSYELGGNISPSIGNLSFLTAIDLSSNNFNGKIPEEFGRLSHLQRLNLSFNSLHGEIPVNLSNCSELSVLSVEHNALIGSIPFQLRSLKKLVHLNLAVNNLTGTIPPWVGNYSSLTYLSLSRNTLQGRIPNELGQLSQLQYFRVSINMLSGVIPPSLYNITPIYFFVVGVNKLHGSLPPNIGQTLPNLQGFGITENFFHGPIPDIFSNASKIQQLDFEHNSFTGLVPNSLGSLRSLLMLGFEDNKLGYGRDSDFNFITSLSNCTNLEYLTLANNQLGGVLPESVGNLSTRLQTLRMGGNLIRGPLPESIENFINLTSLSMEENLFSGSIPFGIGKLERLNELLLQENKLSGKIPSSLGNLTQLIELHMNHNWLEGIIPPTLGNCKHLILLNISSNSLSGTIPKQVLTLSSLSISFSVAHNSLSGSLPSEVGNLNNLEELDISDNKLSGEIPGALGNCRSLEYLRMGGNLFQGPIPLSLKDLRGIQIIDFSHNNLTGKIPEFLMNILSLDQLDLSYNDFDGKVPKEGIFKNASAISVRGNKKLCGGVKDLHLPICNDQKVGRSPRLLIIIAFGVLSFTLVAIGCSAYWLRTSRKTNTAGAAPTTTCALEKWQCGASYTEIFYSTNGFSPECLLGTGSFGSVFRGILSDQETFVAIKVLNLQHKDASKNFMAECEALKNIRHRNLMKIVTVCSSTDLYGNDFKALIFEFMPNGSLEQWLHPADIDGRQNSRTLKFVQRLNVAIDVAFGLEYLHHSYDEVIAHCDIKPSNVLLDWDMTARVGDFGLARFLFNTANGQPETQTLSSGLKGSIGYIPPEYGMSGKVSTHGDMYSYGILVLEMFTGKRPTDEMFKDGLSLYDYVVMALPDRVLDIIDASLLSDIQEEDDEKRELKNAKEIDEAPTLSRRYKRGEHLVSVLRIALSCCAPLPKDRMVMHDIVKRMIDVRDLFVYTP